MFGDLDALAVSPVVDVPAGAGVSVDNPERDALISDQAFENPTDLTARARAQRHRDVQGSDHPCLPDALPTRVDMQLDLVSRLLDSDGQERSRRKDHH